MAKLVQIWLLVLCLGLFIIPKQYFIAQNSTESCCAISLTQKEDHCKLEHKKDNCHKEGKNKNHCTGNCNNCDICHFSLAVFRMPIIHEIDLFITDENSKEETSLYITPEISDIFSKIWQPPKIA